MKFRLFCVCMVCLVGMPTLVSGQSKWTGSWSVHYQPWPHIPEIAMTLHVAEPTAEMLYPAKLTLVHGGFTGEYELLLVMKNAHQLGIGRNKYPTVEEPFGLGPWMMYLNGVLEHRESDHTLTLKRVWIDRFGIFMHGLYDNEFYTNTKAYIRDFLYREDITMTKVDGQPWKHPHTQRIVHTDSIYYGVYDPIETTSDWLSLFLQDEERYDRDTVTVVHNGRVLADRLPLERALALDSIQLDTGANYIAFFADNYGDMPPNTAHFIVGTTDQEGQLYGFDFSDRANAYATVMVANIRYAAPSPAPEVTAEVVRDTAAPERVPTDTVAPERVPARATEPNAVHHTRGRRDLRVGEWEVHTERVVLEIWDEQIEDGDVVSLEVNGARVANEVEVSKDGRKIGVSLRPGRNRIVFMAENLGRIPPNTAALRVLSGGEERRFQLSTDFERNNVLDIFFRP